MSAVKILLVEDDRSIAVSLVDGLTSAGHEVVHVTTGAAALELEAAVAPDVVLLDLGLPDMDGMQVVRELQDGSPCAVLILTGRNDVTDLRTAAYIVAIDRVAKTYRSKGL